MPEVVRPGDIAEAELIIDNTTLGATVTVQFEARIVYSDGTVDQLSRVKKHGGLEIGSGQEIVLNLLFLVPDDAAAGAAVFLANAKVTRLTGEKKCKYSHPLKASAAAWLAVIGPAAAGE